MTTSSARTSPENAGGTLTEMPEDAVFTAITRRLAVREENTMVARVTLHNTRQDRDEPIRAYGARLRGQASVCKYTQQCTGCEANVDYTEAILRDVLCRGLGDTEIQMDLLGDKNQDMTLEQVFKSVEAKEAGEGQLPQAADAVAGSKYKKQKRPSARTPSKDQDTCTLLLWDQGASEKPPTRVRRTECPAFGTKCNNCDRDHHFEKVCRGKNGTKPTGGNRTRQCSIRHTV